MAHPRDIQLPDGVSWRPLTDEDRRWLAATTGTDPETCVAIDISVTIRVAVTIRHPDGRERVYVDDWYPFAVEPTVGLIGAITFQWRDGNYGCDCNRAAFFARAGGEPEPDVECGGSYRIAAPGWLADHTPRG